MKLYSVTGKKSLISINYHITLTFLHEKTKSNFSMKKGSKNNMIS
jgi:hypothetical protein